MQTETDKIHEKKSIGNLNAKEKKFLELNPNLNLEQLKGLSDKNTDELKTTKSKVNFNFEKSNNSKLNRVRTNTSNIFHNEVSNCLFFLINRVNRKF